MPEIRNYQPQDERSWLHCRVLSFLDTCYYDDVWTSRPQDAQIQLVALDDADVIAILDVSLEKDLATIDTVCVHPDWRRHGIAQAMLTEAVRLLPGNIRTLDAWTREDPEILEWYRHRGFVESDHYLHVYKGWDEPEQAGWSAPEPLTSPLMAYCQATIEHEEELRARYKRVYVCRGFSQTLPLR